MDKEKNIIILKIKIFLQVKNGKKNGKGKEYDNKNGYLMFEGEYFNDKRNGKGKEYYIDKLKRILFEGEYLNGKRKGNWKEYNFEGQLKFEGEYINDKRNGKGKEYIYYNKSFSNKDNINNIYSIFEGEYINNKRNGKGKEYTIDGILIEEGEYLNDEKII